MGRYRDATRCLVRCDFLRCIDVVDLNDILRQVQTNKSNLHDTSPSMQVTFDNKLRRERGVHMRPDLGKSVSLMKVEVRPY